MLKNINIQDIINIVQLAGNKILKIYDTNFEIEYKKDNSPLTEADKESNKTINKGLTKLYPQIPILSEENKSISYETRKKWEYFWLVDPLDGTKEFIKKNGEFTVNIALIEKNRPILGVIYTPVLKTTYYAIKGKGSYKIDKNGKTSLLNNKNEYKSNKGIIKMIASRSHRTKGIDILINNYQSKGFEIELKAIGSSLKFCILAEGTADIYPRLAPTMEWDTGAGEIIAIEADKSVRNWDNNYSLQYNKENLLNPYFIVE